MQKRIPKFTIAAGAMMCALTASAQWTITGTVVRPTTLSNNVSIGTTVNGANLYVEKATAVTLGIKSTSAGATMFMDRGSATSNSAFAYRSLGVQYWNSGMLGNNNYSIRNVAANTFPLIVDGTTDNIILNSTGTSGSFAATFPLTLKTGPVTAIGLDNGASINVKDNTGSSVPFMWPLWTDNRTYMNYGSEGFEIRNNSGTPTMLMTSDNKVGVGTSFPASTLDVRGGFSGASGIITVGTNVNTGGAIYFGNGNHGIQRGFPTVAADNNVGFFTTSGNLYLSTNGGSTGEFVLTDGGNVYINGDGSNFAGAKLGVEANQSAITGIVNISPAAAVTGVANGGAQAYGIYGVSSAGYAGYFIGDVFTTGSYLPSDEKLKRNIAPLQNALAKVMKLEVKTYNYNTSEFSKMNLPAMKQNGFIAQNLETVFPELIRNNEENTLMEQPSFKAVNYIGMIPVLTEAIQEQQNQIENQKAKNQAIEKQLAEKDARIEQLTKQVADMIACIQSLCNEQNSKIGAVETTSNLLFQNSPNPFNQTTVIRYALTGDAALARIIIRDLKGKLVKSIDATGKTQVIVDANELSQGTYTYTLEINGKSIDTKLMVVTQ